MSHPLLRPLEALLEKHDLRRWARAVRLNGSFEFLQCYCGEKILTDSNEAMFAHVAERVLKESGLADLLEAGQAMREDVGGAEFSNSGAAWDRALAKVKGKSA